VGSFFAGFTGVLRVIEKPDFFLGFVLNVFPTMLEARHSFLVFVLEHLIVVGL
jgi:hypothetical protein